MFIYIYIFLFYFFRKGFLISDSESFPRDEISRDKTGKSKNTEFAWSFEMGFDVLIFRVAAGVALSGCYASSGPGFFCPHSHRFAYVSSTLEKARFLLIWRWNKYSDLFASISENRWKIRGFIFAADYVEICTSSGRVVVWLSRLWLSVLHYKFKCLQLRTWRL